MEQLCLPIVYNGRESTTGKYKKQTADCRLPPAHIYFTDHQWNNCVYQSFIKDGKLPGRKCCVHTPLSFVIVQGRRKSFEVVCVCVCVCVGGGGGE